MVEIIGIILVILFVCIALYVVVSPFIYLSYLFIKNFKSTDLGILLFTTKEEKESLNQFYTNKFSYYNLLNGSEKAEFINRVIKFRSRNQLDIKPSVTATDDEVTLMINGAFVQITFGYNDYDELAMFDTIVIYPNTFFSRRINHEVKGLTTATGVIHYSWSDFIKGYQNETDKINLALHELAHAFYAENFSTDDNRWELWKQKALTAIKEEQKTSEPFFRAYGKTNLAEFWAVAIECFFEDPINFKQKYAPLYEATTALMQQDMAAKKQNAKEYNL